MKLDVQDHVCDKMYDDFKDSLQIIYGTEDGKKVAAIVTNPDSVKVERVFGLPYKTITIPIPACPFCKKDLV